MIMVKILMKSIITAKTNIATVNIRYIIISINIMILKMKIIYYKKW